MNTGNLVIYKGKAAVITAVSKDKIDVRTQEGKSASVRMKDLELLHTGQVTSLNFPEAPQVDWEELTELADENGFSFAEFTELAYGESTPATAWFAWNALKEGVYFVGTPGAGVKLQTLEKREELLRKKDEKESKKKERDQLIERIRNNALEKEDLKYLREIEAVGNGESENSSLMKDLGTEVIPAKAHALLLRVGAWEELYDPWPRRLGVDISFPRTVLAQDEDEEREDLTAHTCYAIDDVASNDPDDAIAFADGLLYVHVADPASVVLPGSDVDEEASWRGESSYLPEILSPMLPEGAVERFGLGLAEKSPAMTFVVRIGDDGTPHLERMALSWIHAERHSYESAAESLMETEEFSAMRDALEKFRQKREENGALFIRLPEVKTRVKEGEILITPCPVTPERELVANAMGLGVCFNAIYPYIVNTVPEVREISGADEGQYLKLSLMIGYPTMSYQRPAKRKRAVVKEL
jgi:exoribonuclease-2